MSAHAAHAAAGPLVTAGQLWTLAVAALIALGLLVAWAVAAAVVDAQAEARRRAFARGYSAAVRDLERAA